MHHHILEAYTGQVFPARIWPEVSPALSVQSDFAVAIATVNRFITAGFEGYLGVFAALGACHGKHLASGPVAAVSVTL